MVSWCVKFQGFDMYMNKQFMYMSTYAQILTLTYHHTRALS